MRNLNVQGLNYQKVHPQAPLDTNEEYPEAILDKRKIILKKVKSHINLTSR
jgi:hypothetical protein